MEAFILVTIAITTRPVFSLSPTEIKSDVEDVIELWNIFKVTCGKKYPADAEETLRFIIFVVNHYRAIQHNKNKETTWTMGINCYTDLTGEEFAQRNLLDWRTNSDRGNYSLGSSPDTTPPSSVDWRKKGAVTPVLDQGECGCCYATSACGAMEAKYFLETGQLVPLSVQNIIDCSGKQGNNGCRSGLFTYAFNYAKENNGTDTAKSYPFEKTNGTCRFNPKEAVGTVQGYKCTPKGNETALAIAVSNQPVSVGVASKDMQFYKKGIFECQDKNGIDHAVLVVGYGSENEKDYWIAKNSWGTGWGEDGYIRIARNKGNQCKIATYACYPY